MGEQQGPVQRRVAQAHRVARQQILQAKYKNKGKQRQQPSAAQVTVTIDESLPELQPLTKKIDRRTPRQMGKKLFLREQLITSVPVIETAAEKSKQEPIKFRSPTEPINPTKPYDRDEFQDRVRAIIALIFVSTFVGTIVSSFVLAAFFSGNKDAWPNIKDLIQIIVTTESGLLGAAVGFYFGEKVGRAS
ncbi:MAG TPA: hypothetical protein VGT44_13910 [Ktedonobacteraceae bacterium]|nr:hypothetical protein [Ktedonobacteraceae bacterium]